MNLYRITGILFFSIILLGCQQEISIKKEKFTATNPVSYTDVIYKANRDTVFVSTFDGKIYELIHGNSKKQQIAAIDDEIYDMAYNAKKNQLYAATLNSGIVAINTQDGSTTNKLPLKIWAKQLTYNAKNGILATADVKGNHYIWETYKGFKQMKTPLALKQLQPTHITDNGDIYFNGKEGILIWNYKNNSIIKNNTIAGQLIDVDEKKNYLLISGKEFGYYHTKTDRVFYKQKHPDWPIYVANKDTTVTVPLSLEIISGMMTTDNIYTCGLDKSLRKWDKQSGELIETYSIHRGTPSAMDISEDGSQLVTVDLLGKIHFWNL